MVLQSFTIRKAAILDKKTHAKNEIDMRIISTTMYLVLLNISISSKVTSIQVTFRQVTSCEVTSMHMRIISTTMYLVLLNISISQ